MVSKTIILRDLDLHFEYKKFEKLVISEMVRGSVKTHGTTFVDFDICHRIAALRNIILRDLDLDVDLFERQQFETLVCLNWLDLMGKKCMGRLL